MGDGNLSEIGRFEFGRDGRVVLSRSSEPLTYYRIRWLTWTWVACLASIGNGCAAVRRAALSLDRAPPALRDQPPPPPTLPGASAAEQMTRPERDRVQLERVIDAIARVHDWWTKPLPPLVPRTSLGAAPAPIPEVVERPIPPFDIQDIPAAMERLLLPVSARMMRHWFAGQANYSKSKEDVTRALDQNGNPIPPT